jgi:5-methylcytosine-specific restriction enzyme A
MSPWRPRPLCPRRGCAHRIPCPDHPIEWAPKQQTTKARGYSGRHVQWRQTILQLYPVCPCGQPATEADHIVPKIHGGDNALSNGQGLCRACHARKTAREAVAYRYASIVRKLPPPDR